MNDGTPKFAKCGKPKNLSLNQLQILGVEGTHQENAGLRSNTPSSFWAGAEDAPPTCREANVNGIVLLLQRDAL
jgi:hypothetical protein